jgi:hypothetical protein
MFMRGSARIANGWPICVIWLLLRFEKPCLRSQILEGLPHRGAPVASGGYSVLPTLTAPQGVEIGHTVKCQ